MPTTARKRPKIETGTDPFIVGKAKFLRQAARTQRLLGGQKTRILSARLDEALVAAAKRRTGIKSDTELVEVALASLAVGDDFGEWLVAQAGRVDPDFDFGL